MHRHRFPHPSLLSLGSTRGRRTTRARWMPHAATCWLRPGDLLQPTGSGAAHAPARPVKANLASVSLSELGSSNRPHRLGGDADQQLWLMIPALKEKGRNLKLKDPPNKKCAFMRVAVLYLNVSELSNSVARSIQKTLNRLSLSVGIVSVYEN